MAPLKEPAFFGFQDSLVEKFKYSNFTSGLPWSVVRCPHVRPREKHSHEFQEIVLVTHGVGLHVSKYASWQVQAGDAFVIGGSQAHCYDDIHDLGLVNVLFQRDLIDLNVLDVAALAGFQALFGVPNLRSHHEFRSRLRLGAKDLSAIMSYVDALEMELASGHDGRAYFSSVWFMLIVGSLSRLYSQQKDLDTHFTESENIGALAHIAGMSERSLLRGFHRATGSSPHNYLLQLRVSRAAEELRKPEKQITEIAFEVGFNDSNYFTRQFKKRMGLTPQEYRKKTPRV